MARHEQIDIIAWAQKTIEGKPIGVLYHGRVEFAEDIMKAYRRGVIDGKRAQSPTPALPPELLALSEKATGGEWRAFRVESGDDGVIGAIDSVGPPEVPICRFGRVEDNDLICAAVNYVRRQITKEQANG